MGHPTGHPLGLCSRGTSHEPVMRRPMGLYDPWDSPWCVRWARQSNGTCHGSILDRSMGCPIEITNSRDVPWYNKSHGISHGIISSHMSHGTSHGTSCMPWDNSWYVPWNTIHPMDETARETRLVPGSDQWDELHTLGQLMIGPMGRDDLYGMHHGLSHGATHETQHITWDFYEAAHGLSHGTCYNPSHGNETHPSHGSYPWDTACPVPIKHQVEAQILHLGSWLSCQNLTAWIDIYPDVKKHAGII